MRAIMFLFFFFAVIAAPGQVTINMELRSSGGEYVFMNIDATSSKISLVFTRRAVPEKARLEVVDLMETKKISIDSGLALLKKSEFISLSEAFSFVRAENALLFTLLDTVVAQRDSLSRVKDKRIVLDGMTCTLNVVNSGEARQLVYRVPQSKANTPIHLFIREILTDLKTSGKNKAVQNYCEKTLTDYFRKEGGAYLSFGEQ